MTVTPGGGISFILVSTTSSRLIVTVPLIGSDSNGEISIDTAGGDQDPALIHDLLIRELVVTSKNTSSLPPFYIVEIRTVKGTDQEMMKNIIFEKTAFLPSITENGTHYVANMRLSLELLKEICESQKDIVKITGDFTGGIGGR
jgi:hypothetical protein